MCSGSYSCWRIAITVIRLMSCCVIIQVRRTFKANGGSLSFWFNFIGIHSYLILLFVARMWVLLHFLLSHTSQSLILIIPLLLLFHIIRCGIRLLLGTHVACLFVRINTVFLFSFLFTWDFHLALIFLIINGIVVALRGRWQSQFLWLPSSGILLLSILLFLFLVLTGPIISL